MNHRRLHLDARHEKTLEAEQIKANDNANEWATGTEGNQAPLIL
jgi:hypothetical protein